MKIILITFGIIFVFVTSLVANEEIFDSDNNLYTSDNTFLQTKWNTKNGLPQNSVESILQTKDDYIWIATLGGLARFDGIKFTVFNPTNTPELKTNRFHSLYEDFEGILWITTDDGTIYFYRNGHFKLLEVEGHDANYYFLKREENGDIWIVLNKFIVKRFKFNETEEVKIQVDYLVIYNSVGAYHTNIIFVGMKLWYIHSGTWLVSVDMETKERKVYKHPKFTNEKIQVIYNSGNDNDIWVVTKTTIGKLKDGNFKSILEGKTQFAKFAFDSNHDFWCVNPSRLIKFTDSGIKEYKLVKLKGTKMQAFMFDSQGIAWVGTDNDGFFGLKKNEMKVYGRIYNNSLASTFSVLEDDDGKIWMGTIGLLSFENGELKYENAYKDATSTLSHVASITKDSKGNIWYANAHNVVKLDRGTGEETVKKIGQVIYSLYFEKNDDLWMGFKYGIYKLIDGNLRYYSKNDGLVDNWVQYITQVKNGDVWIGTRNGISRFRNGNFTNYTTENGLSNNNIRDIFEDEDGVIWIGTYGGGVIRFKNGVFKPITTEEGLPENIASSLVLDDNDRFWLLGNNGIYSASRQSFNDIADGKIDRIVCSVFDSDDGMYVTEGNGINQYSSWKAKDGTLWFTMVKGFLSINPNIKSNKVPKVYIEKVLVSKKNQDIGKNIEIPYGMRDIEIEYTGIDLMMPENIQFRYKLEGLSDEWNYVGRNRTAYFTFLPAGTYVFTVEAASSSGKWNIRSSTIKIRVLSPFWKTSWFITANCLLILVIIYIIHRLRLRGLENKQIRQRRFSERLIDAHEEERKRIASDLHDSLGQNLMVIKTWTGIALGRIEENTETGKILKQVNEVATTSIQDTRNIVVNLLPVHLQRLGLTKTIQNMVEQLNSTSTIEFEHSVEEVDGVLETRQELSVYRIIQESLNNIIKHSKASEASVTIKERIGFILIRIEDNGVGFDIDKHINLKSKSTGVGVNNLIERVSLIKGDIEIDSKLQKGTSIKISLLSTKEQGNNNENKSRFSR